MRILRKPWVASLVPLAALVALLFGPSAAQAASGIESGHPELYENGTRVPGESEKDIQTGFGEIHLESAQLGSEGIECVNVGFGSGWNAGTAPTLRAVGQLLGWDASGHVPEGTHTKLSSSCRPETTGKAGSYATDEGYVKSEENGSHEVEASLRKLSVPWNVEVDCGDREESYTGIVKIGVPTSEFPVAAPKCPENLETGQTEEEEAYTKERTEKHGCYVSNPAPEGCVHVTIVEPGAGLEVAFGGTLRAHGENGVHNGLFPTKWVFEGAASGALQCEFPTSCTATGVTTGSVKEIGYKGIGLIQAKE